MSKRTDKLTKDNFTLLNIVEFMEANGFHVREAREIEREHIYPPFGNLKTHPATETFAPVQKPDTEIEAIRLEIAPKTED